MDTFSALLATHVGNRVCLYIVPMVHSTMELGADLHDEKFIHNSHIYGKHDSEVSQNHCIVYPLNPFN